MVPVLKANILSRTMIDSINIKQCVVMKTTLQISEYEKNGQVVPVDTV